MTHTQAIATEIRNQIGARALFMLGAKDLFCSEIEHSGYKRPYLGFKISGSPTVNYIRVIYNEGTDEYIMQFVKVKASEIKIINEVENVHAEDMHHLLEQYTGLFITL